MVWPILALERLSFLEQEGKILYRHGDEGAKLERMDYLKLIARVTSHIPGKGQVTVRCYGLYAKAHRGKVRKSVTIAEAKDVLEFSRKYACAVLEHLDRTGATRRANDAHVLK